MNAPLIRAVALLRVSTEDKGQDPQRQLDVIYPWAHREGAEIVAVIVDEGTSASKSDPFTRSDAIERANEQAKKLDATAIVVECSDRFSRQGSKLDAWAEVELERRYGLRLLRADKPLADHGGMTAAVTDTIHAESARAWVQAHASKVRSGMARKRAEGARFGRPTKPLSPEELALVARLRAEGHGWRVCAREVNRARGALELTDARARTRASVTHTLVRRVIEALAVTKVEP